MIINEEDLWIAECLEADCGWARPTQTMRQADLLCDAHTAMTGHAAAPDQTA